jgi:hypothetical protein
VNETENDDRRPEEEEPEGAPPETDAEALPESVPDDWLDPKPFDPAGR